MFGLLLLIIIVVFLIYVVWKDIKKSDKQETTNVTQKQTTAKQNCQSEKSYKDSKNIKDLTTLKSVEPTTKSSLRSSIEVDEEREEQKAKIKRPHYVRKIYDEFVALDFETTGLNHETHKIIEIAALKFKDGVVVDKFVTLVNPEQRIPSSIIRKTGITNAMVKDKPTINEVLPQLLEFIGKSPIVAHNASFDLSFLKYNVALLYGRDTISNPVIDTLTLSKRLFSKDDIENYKLGTVAEYIGVSIDNYHRAEADAYAAAQIYLYWCENCELEV